MGPLDYSEASIFWESIREKTNIKRGIEMIFLSKCKETGELFGIYGCCDIEEASKFIGDGYELIVVDDDYDLSNVNWGWEE